LVVAEDWEVHVVVLEGVVAAAQSVAPLEALR